MTWLTSFRWTRDRILVALALTLGVLALAGTPTNGHTVRIDTQELSAIVASKLDHVSPGELADRIIRGATDYRLVDVREPAEFEAYHIPTAENVPITALPDFGLGRNEDIILYSGGGIHAGQAWFLLRAQGYHAVRFLAGGLDAWKDEVVFPVAPVGAAAHDAAAFERAVQVARFFGGAPRAAASGDGASSVLQIPSATPVRSQVALPKLPATGKATPLAKKKREGC